MRSSWSTATVGGVGPGQATVQPGDARAHGLEAGLDGRAGVLAPQLAELTLAGEQPQRVGDLGPQARAQVVGARQRLEALPRGDRAHGRLPVR